MAKNPPASQETCVWSLGKEDLLEKEMATQSSIPAWRISWTKESGGLQPMGSQRVKHNWATNTLYEMTLLSLSINIYNSCFSSVLPAKISKTLCIIIGPYLNPNILLSSLTLKEIYINYIYIVFAYIQCLQLQIKEHTTTSDLNNKETVG